METEAEWRPVVVPGHDKLSLSYSVSNMGGIRGHIRHRHLPRDPIGRDLRPYSKKGYALISLHLGKQGSSLPTSVHRLVALAFIPNPENKPQVNHKNGIRNDNRVDNLEWMTCSENHRHSWRVLGRKSPHSRHPGKYFGAFSRFSDADLRAIVSDYATGEFSQPELAAKWGCCRAYIGNIVRGTGPIHLTNQNKMGSRSNGLPTDSASHPPSP